MSLLLVDVLPPERREEEKEREESDSLLTPSPRLPSMTTVPNCVQ